MQRILDEGIMNETTPNSHIESSLSINIHKGESRKSDDVDLTNIGREYNVDETFDQTPGDSIDFEECPFEQRSISKECRPSLDDKVRKNPVQVVSTPQKKVHSKKSMALPIVLQKLIQMVDLVT